MVKPQQLTIPQAIKKAKKAIKKGNISAAQQLYNEVLKHQPDHPVAIKGLRKLEKKLSPHQFFQTQITNPSQDQINALTNLYYSGQNTKAEQVCKELLQTFPQSLFVINVLGAALKRQGKLQEAVQAFDKAIQHKPDYAQAYSNRGVALQELGQLKEAVRSCDKAIQFKPDYAEAHSNRGNALRDLDQQEEAVRSYDKAIQLKLDYAEAHNNRGVALQELGQLKESVDSYNKAIQLKPDYAEAHSNLCYIYEKHNMLVELKSALHQAQEILPKDNPHFLYNLAKFASREKRFEDACYILESIVTEKLPPLLRQEHSELLGKTYDKLDLFSKAFTQFEITSEITKQSCDYQKFSGKRYLEKVSQKLEFWSNTTKIKWPVKQVLTNQPLLTFLVGFPRSGTTLLDTILRSHPEISVVEEKPMVETMHNYLGGHATPDRLSILNSRQITELKEVYLKELDTHVKFNSSHKIIIDKLPLNITQADLIHRIFPDAKFILALRHPCDCVLSCFMQNFKLNDAMVNFLTLQQSAKLYDAVMSLWVLYANTLDIKVSVVKYEDLVQDLQSTVKPLLNFLSVDWHDNLLNYQQTALSRGKINTPSYNQVTQSLYTQASGRWKNYQDHIKEIMPLLEPWVKRFGYQTVP